MKLWHVTKPSAVMLQCGHVQAVNRDAPTIQPRPSLIGGSGEDSEVEKLYSCIEVMRCLQVISRDAPATTAVTSK